MIIVTGGAGFIGSNLVKKLNEKGKNEIIVVDDLTNAEKIKNLRSLQIVDYIDKDKFLEHIIKGHSFGPIQAILHQGACSDTMAKDGRYVMHNNYDYSKWLYHYCEKNEIQFVYASSAAVYGAGSVFIETPENENALNVYAYSKLLFDNYVRQQVNPGFQVVGLRYFNVYGEREQHKNRMASVVWHFYHQYCEQQQVRLFQGCDGYGDGEQKRDFISIEDVIKINIFLLENPAICGIYNVGTGICRSFNDIALATINSIRRNKGQDKLLLVHDAVNEKLISYYSMPNALHGKYQSYTQADISQLRQVGYKDSFLSLEEGVEKYVQHLVCGSDHIR